MYIIGLAIICSTIYAITEEICDYLKNKKDKEME